MSDIRFAPLALVALLALVTLACGESEETPEPAAPTEPGVTATEPAGAGELSLTSSAFGDNESIPVRYTCDGDNISPPLTISGVPEGAAALALLVDDPDAPGGSFVHWTVANIDPTVTEVPEGAVPQGGVEGTHGAGGTGYTGPCPPSGEHRYVFTLYALDAPLALEAGAFDKEALLAAIEGHVIAETTLTGLYER